MQKVKTDVNSQFDLGSEDEQDKMSKKREYDTNRRSTGPSLKSL